jgi:DNA-binding response OmpR family regulator
VALQGTEMDDARILIVDDNTVILELLEDIFKDEGWKIIKATDGTSALEVFEKELPDLVILDIMMPQLDGYEVLRMTRKWPQTPFIMLSGRGEISDKVRCLNLGADDYITKPFAEDELVARVKAVLRRKSITASFLADSFFSDDNIEVNFVTMQVKVAGAEVKLTPIECKLLKELISNRGQVLTYAFLLEKVWGSAYKDERQYLHVFINQLRTKLESDHRKPEYIINVPGVGYRFNISE